MNILLCFAVGIVFFAIELVVPGMVLGVAGAIVMFVGVGLAFADFGWDGGLWAATLALTVLAGVIYAELVWLPKSRLARYFSMGDTLTEKSQPPVAEAATVLGAEAVVETALSPSGYVRVAGRRYEAFCQDGFAAVGTRLRVRGLDNFRLIVSAS